MDRIRDPDEIKNSPLNAQYYPQQNEQDLVAD